jgi:hypothetical protein
MGLIQSNESKKIENNNEVYDIENPKVIDYVILEVKDKISNTQKVINENNLVYNFVEEGKQLVKMEECL